MGIYDNPTAFTVGGGANAYATNEIQVDMHGSMFDSYPALTPLTVILTRMAETGSSNFRIDWTEKKRIPTTVIVAATEASASTSITVVANGTTLVVDTLLYNPRNDDLRILSATPTTNAITVAVDQGGKTSTVWQTGDVIHVLLPAIAENDATEWRNVSVADENFYNFQQLAKLQYSITRISNDTATHFGGPGSKRAELKTQKYEEFRIKKEKMVYFGGRATSGSGASTKRMAGGLVHFLRQGTLYKDFGGMMTESGFRNFIGSYKEQNPESTEATFFCAGNVIDIIDTFGSSKIRIDPSSKEYGLDILRYKSRGLTTKLVAMPLLDVPVTQGWGFLLDMNRVMLKTMNRDMFYPEAKNVGESEVIYDTYRGVYSLLVGNESKHAMCVGALN